MKKAYQQNSRLSEKFNVRPFIVFIVLLFVIVEVSAQGGLLITPRRVVFDGTSSTQKLNLANTGDERSTYIVSFVQYRMTESGEFELIEEPDPGQHFADKHLRLYPRKVTLEPREAQMIKVQVRNYKVLEDGEYRSYLYFRLQPEVKPLGEENNNADTNSVTVKLVPIFGISVPVIIKKGESTTEITITDIELDNTTDTVPVLTMKINRTGNMSAYGDIEVDFVGIDNKRKQVAVVRGLAVYTPNNHRIFSLSLDKDTDYINGELQVKYKNRSDLKREIIAESVLKLE